ncbi:MAG TPA: TolC family protein, partial [Polyangiaceae bacterium]
MTEARIVVRLAASLAVFVVSGSTARAADAPPEAPPVPTAVAPAGAVTLKRCLELALKNFPRIHEAMAKARAKRADVDVAHFAPYTEFLVDGALGPAPTVRGTNIFSPNTDAALTSHMGLAWNLGVEGTIPLWTFGKITNLWDAAEANARAGEHAVEKERNDVRLAVRRAYYAAKAARDGQLIVTDAMHRLDRFLPNLARKV